LKKGQKVTFDAAQGPKGKIATNIIPEYTGIVTEVQRMDLIPKWRVVIKYKKDGTDYSETYYDDSKEPRFRVDDNVTFDLNGRDFDNVKKIQSA